MHGFLNVLKPAGYTSREAVDRVKRYVKPEKAGHAGTLDPIASGVLVVAIGHATRLIEYVQESEKDYLAEFFFGRTSDTEDISGNVEELIDPPQPSREEIEAILPQFSGSISQTPPAFSAVKVDGKRAYALARKGREVEIAPRTVVIHSLALEHYEYPRMRLKISCGSGTYVRALGRDLARALGTEAIMSDLVRTRIGLFAIAESTPMYELSRDMISERVVPAQRGIECLPKIVITRTEIEELRRGRSLAVNHASHAGEALALSESGELVAIVIGSGPLWKPYRVFDAY